MEVLNFWPIYEDCQKFIFSTLWSASTKTWTFSVYMQWCVRVHASLYVHVVLCAGLLQISLGTVTTVEEAVKWLSYTYLYVRMRCNPLVYGVSHIVLQVTCGLSLLFWFDFGMLCFSVSGISTVHLWFSWYFVWQSSAVIFLHRHVSLIIFCTLMFSLNKNLQVTR